jgi:hypothetical protein
MNTPPIELKIPHYWEPHEALAVFELLHELTDLIWAQYEIPLLELLAEQQDSHHGSKLIEGKQLDLFDPDDSMQF